VPENRYTSVLKLLFEHGQSCKQQVDVIRGNQQIWIAEENERRALCFLSRENRSEIGVRGDDDPVFVQSSRENLLITCCLHFVQSNMNRIVPRCHKEVRHARRERIVDQEPQAECGRGSSRSMAEAAAKRKHSRMSSISRSGYSARISCSANPPASIRSTEATGIRRCRTHGTPPICAGSTVIRSKFFTTRLLS